MSNNTSCYVVDDDPAMAKLLASVLEQDGYDVTTLTSSREALSAIQSAKPACAFLDIMMPEMDGLELCKRLRESSDLSDMKIIMVSAKTYDFDKRRARMLGADGYIIKPIQADSFREQVRKMMADEVQVAYWGVRGTLPVSGQRTMRYGGNTSCVTMSFAKDQFFVFDAGSGIKELSSHLMRQGKKRLTGKIFLSHPHWDHINAFPFFVPLFIPGNEFEVIGPRHGDLDVRDLVNAQMDGVYFPITMREFGAHLLFRNLGEESFEIDGIQIETMLLSHPGYCLGYRINYNGRSICYITDNELFAADDPQRNPTYVDRLVSFLKGADLVITDTTYFDDEYKMKVGWGHCSISQVVEFVSQAEVKTLHLFHHDPDQSDDDIDRKLDIAREKMAATGAKTVVQAPAEGDSLWL